MPKPTDDIQYKVSVTIGSAESLPKASLEEELAVIKKILKRYHKLLCGEEKNSKNNEFC